MQKRPNHKEIKFFDGVIPPRRISKVRERTKKILFRSTFKMAGVSLVAFVLLVNLSSVGSTVSYFNDTETSTGNKLQAGILGFTGGYDEEYSATTEENIGSESFDVIIRKSDTSLPLIYTATGVLDPLNPEGCGALVLTAGFGDYDYDGIFTEFASPATTTMGEWQFLVSLPVDGTELAPYAECKGEIVFHAGLAGVSDDLTHTFTDEKSYKFEIYNWQSGGSDSSPVLEVVSTPPPPNSLTEVSLPEIFPVGDEVMSLDFESTTLDVEIIDVSVVIDGNENGTAPATEDTSQTPNLVPDLVATDTFIVQDTTLDTVDVGL